jgi:3'-5' exonuclease
VFSSFSSQGKATLHEISRVMGLPGKPKGFDGGEVERHFHEGKIKEIADYCETDVINTYRVWLRYEVFRGTLSQSTFEASERNLADFIIRRSNVEERLYGMASKNSCFENPVIGDNNTNGKIS